MNQPSSRPATKRILALVFLAALFSAACALIPTVPAPDSPPTAAATAVNTAPTEENDMSAVATAVSAASNASPANQNNPANPAPTAGSASSQATLPPPPNAPPRPTLPGRNGGAPPTKPANPPGGPAAADNTAPVIASADSSAAEAYYNDASCGSTTVAIRAAVSDDTAVDQVWVSYIYAGGPAGDWRQAVLQPTGGNQYEAIIDVGQEAANDLQGSDGVMQYQVSARDAAGNVSTLPDGNVYGVQILSCGVLGAPPADNRTISIGNIQLSPAANQLYYGACTTEPTTLNVQATIDPLDRIASAKLMYRYVNSVGVSPEYEAAMFQLGIGDYAGDIDTAVNAANSMGTDDGRLEFYIEVMDTDGSIADSSLQSVDLFYCSGSSQAPPPGGAPGQGVVSFVNNSSHPIISLVVDGTEMFPAEPQGILPGDSYDVPVSDGSHSFTALNGWWEFGSRRAMYTFSGSFTPQDGNVTFNDPTIQELLTNWGNYRYFQSSYMGNDGNFHFVGFCFYPDGTFREYDNGAEVDSGAYAEVSRGNNLITVRLTGQSVSVDALYYETFALLDVPRGSVADEYAPDDTAVCP